MSHYSLRVMGSFSLFQYIYRVVIASVVKWQLLLVCATQFAYLPMLQHGQSAWVRWYVVL